MTLTTLPISSERCASEVIFSDTVLEAVAIFSMVAVAACITAPPWVAVSADSRLAPAAFSALWLISPMVAVISWAAAAIWLVLLDWVFALPALWTERALISVVAALRVSAPWAKESMTERMALTLLFKASDRRP